MMVCYKLRDMFNPTSLLEIEKKREQGKKRNRLSKKCAMHQCCLVSVLGAVTRQNPGLTKTWQETSQTYWVPGDRGTRRVELKDFILFKNKMTSV